MEVGGGGGGYRMKGYRNLLINFLCIFHSFRLFVTCAKWIILIMQSVENEVRTLLAW